MKEYNYLDDKHVIDIIKNAIANTIPADMVLDERAEQIKTGFQHLSDNAILGFVSSENGQFVIIGEEGHPCPHCNGTGRVPRNRD